MAASDIPATSEVLLETDGSKQILDAFLGKGWDAWGQGLGGSQAAELMLQLFSVFNLVALAVISALFVWVSAIAVAGTAHEGVPFGKRYSSLWMPVRFVGAMGALAPIFKGLSLFQVAILACIGFSINLGNYVWELGTDYFLWSMGDRCCAGPAPKCLSLCGYYQWRFGIPDTPVLHERAARSECLSGGRMASMQRKLVLSPVVNIRSSSVAMPEVSASAVLMKATPCAEGRSMQSGRPFRLFRLLPVSWPILTRQRQPFRPVPSMTLRIKLMRPFFPVCKSMPDKASFRASSESFRNGLPATAGSWPVLPTGLWRGSIKKFGKPCIPALPTVRMNTRNRNFMRK